MKRIMRTAGKMALWLAGIWVILLVVLEAALSPTVLTGIVNKYAAEYVDGDLSFGKASVSMFRRFPNVSLTLDDFSITYPADRFDTAESQGPQGHLLHHGCGEQADTLASFKRFSASISIGRLLLGTIRIPHMELEQPRIFAHSYADGQANWNIFRLGTAEDESEEEESDGAGLPHISLGRIGLTGHPHVVYTDSKDTLFAMIDMKQMVFKGRLTTGSTSRNRIGLELDSMFVAGRMTADTIALGLDRLHIHEHGKHADITANAKTFAATRSFGRIRIPVNITGSLSFPRDTVPAVSVSDLTVSIADIPIVAEADIRLHDDSTAIRAKVGIKECRLNDILTGFGKTIIPQAEKIGTDAVLSLTADCDGHYIHSIGRLPDFNITLEIPDSRITHTDFGREIRIGLRGGAASDSKGRVNVTVDTVAVSTAGMILAAKGGMKDLLGDDPDLDIDGRFSASFDSLMTFMPDTLGIKAGGNVEAAVKGSIRMSQIDMYRFSEAKLTGSVGIDDMILKAPVDSLDAFIRNLDITLGPEVRTARRDSTKSFRMLALTGKIDSTYVAYKDALTLRGKGITFSAKNSAEQKDGDTTRIYPLSGTVGADRLSIKDAEGSHLALRGTVNRFVLRPKRGNVHIPVMTLTSRNKRIFLKSPTDRLILTDADFKAQAAMNSIERRQKRKAFLDSLAKVYPDIPRDSLFAHLRAKRMALAAARPLPDWLKEEDFRKQDINIKLDETLAKYFREWDLNGSISVGKGRLMTPYFPLKNNLQGFKASFTNDKIGIDSLRLASGESILEAKGSLSGLKRTLLGKGMLKFDLDVTSDKINANELLKAYTAGASYTPPADKTALAEASDEEFMEMVAGDTTAVAESPSLIVIPANFNADIKLDARNIKYSELEIARMTADMMMKERCLQVTNTVASSNMGNLSFEGFYSSRTKKDLKAGFSFGMEDITAEKVISLMPAVDTLMPMLKSFKGLLNCEFAATADLDTNMNIVMPSINGIMRITGDNLSVSDNEMFRTLAKKLLFKNKKEGRIDHMSVEGVIADNKVEIFPFVMKMDRYTLAMSGIQNLDMSFKYHVSVIRSPFLIRLGIDLSGPDFDNMKFRIGRAKYKNVNVPAFSAVIDETKINLVESIRGIFKKGVDAAIRENSGQEAITEHKKKIGYVQAVDQKLEELSAEEQKQMAAEEAAGVAGGNAGGAAEGTGVTGGNSGSGDNLSMAERTTELKK